MLSFLLSDHLGSSSVTTNANGIKTAQALYKAFGETRFSFGSLGTDYKFTGQREEASLGIYFFQSRWYDGALGRFLSPDTIVPTGTQGTQAWDRYAFVNNNPVRYNDPTGHSAEADYDRSHEDDPCDESVTDCTPEPEDDGNEDNCTATNDSGGLSCTITLTPDEARALKDALETARLTEQLIYGGILVAVGFGVGGFLGAAAGFVLGYFLVEGIDKQYEGALGEIDDALEDRSTEDSPITITISRESYKSDTLINGSGMESHPLGSTALDVIFMMTGLDYPTWSTP